MIRRLFAILLCAIGSMTASVPTSSAAVPEPIDRISDDTDGIPGEASQSRDDTRRGTWHPVDNFR